MKPMSFSLGRSRQHDASYEQLPASDADFQHHGPSRKASRFRRRPALVALSCILTFLAAVGVWLWLFFTGSVGIPKPILHALAKESQLPPLYSRFHQYELQLPQHNLDDALSGSNKDVKYFWLDNHIRGNGWGNYMQEFLLNSYLSYRAGRSLVFNNFTWNEGVSDYSIYNLKPIPSRTPLTALLEGPSVGGPFLADPSAPRAVMKEFWDQICPHPTVIDNNDIVASFEGDPTSEQVVEKWVDLLTTTDDRCVEVKKDERQVFDIWLLQDANRLLDLWPSFSQSPIMTQFRWSELIELAFDTNREVFAPSHTLEPSSLSIPPEVTQAERYTPIPGLLAVHIRRGDFVRHCKRLAGWESQFTGYNAFPALPDHEVRAPGMESLSKDELYRVRCFPEINEIVKRIEDVRSSEAGQGLQNIYIMTNAPTAWIDDLKVALRSSQQWESIASSRDLLVNPEQEYVKQAVDMLIGQRAQVLIGNGFSSLTGQVNMLRMANNFPAQSIRLW